MNLKEWFDTHNISYASLKLKDGVKLYYAKGNVFINDSKCNLAITKKILECSEPKEILSLLEIN